MQKTSRFISLMAVLLFNTVPALASAPPEATPTDVLAPKPDEFLAPGEVMLPIPPSLLRPTQSLPPHPATGTVGRLPIPPAIATVAAKPSPADAEAHWIWLLLSDDTISLALDWFFTAGVSLILGWLGLRGSRLGYCILCIAAGVRETYAAFVRPAKLASANGKLSEADRAEAMDQAIQAAARFAALRGLDLFKYMSKEMAGTVGEFFVRLFKGGAKGGVLVPLDDSAPLPPGAS